MFTAQRGWEMCMQFETDETDRYNEMGMRYSVLHLNHEVLSTCAYLINSICMWLIPVLSQIV